MQTVFTIDHLKGRAVRSIFGLLLVSYAVFRCTDHYNHGGVWRIQLFSSFTIPRPSMYGTVTYIYPVLGPRYGWLFHAWLVWVWRPPAYTTCQDRIRSKTASGLGDELLQARQITFNVHGTQPKSHGKRGPACHHSYAGSPNPITSCELWLPGGVEWVIRSSEYHTWSGTCPASCPMLRLDRSKGSRNDWISGTDPVAWVRQLLSSVLGLLQKARGPFNHIFFPQERIATSRNSVVLKKQ